MTLGSSLQCCQCEHRNADAAQSCAACGHALYEPCVQCSNPVTLIQKLCASCGQDLVQWLGKRTADNESRLGDAVVAAKQFEYDRALTILSEISELTDCRFATQAARAEDAKAKIQQLRDRIVGEANTRMAEAKKVYERGEPNHAVSLLVNIPDPLLDDPSRQILKSGKVFLQQISRLQEELQQSLTGKEHAVALGLVSQLLELQPDVEKYRTLAVQLSERTIQLADQLFRGQEYEAASNALATIPQPGRTDTFTEMQSRIATVRWLSQQFDNEPFATNTLGRLAMRFAKETPGNSAAADLVTQLRQSVKAKRATRRDAFADWKGSRTSWLGGRLGVFARPRTLELSKVDPPVHNYGPYAVAIGLALQGIGRARISGNMIVKKGVFAKMARANSKQAWGIDVGSSSIRAVLMRVEKDLVKPIVVKCVTVDFSVPMSRDGDTRVDDGSQEILVAMKTLLEQIDLTRSSVWSNLPARDAIGRFCILPTVKDKEANKLIEMEVRGRVPIPKEDLALITWRHNLDNGSKTGRPLLMSAATQATVTQRVEMLGSSGLRVDGIVPEPIALANFAAFEFADLLGPDPSPGDEEADKKKSDWDRLLSMEEKQSTVAIVDVGATKTTLVLVSSISVWFGTEANGGEGITAIVARETKAVAEQAELSKRNLAVLPFPDQADQPIEQTQAALKTCLVNLLNEANKTFRNMNISETWCVGSGHLQHGFLRRVLAK